jgi:SAM-dependent methyltransferase
MGADPFIDYLYELEHPEQTVRFYEWRGIVAIVRALIGTTAAARWLDFGCGNGGLMLYGRAHTSYQIDGFEEGWIRQHASDAGIMMLTEAELTAREGTYDVVTAIEVLEHIVDPMAALRQIRRLLKPGGIFFYTTGNAQPFRDRLPTWRYVIPEIHVSFYEPATLARALTLAGFQPIASNELAGWHDIIRYKILKGLGVHQRTRFERWLPWKLLTWMADQRLRITAHPAARAVE